MPTPPTLLITNGRVIDPASGRDETADVAIADGRIAEIGPRLTRSPAERVIDAAGRIVCPGLIDPHVHLREPGQEHKETVASGSRAAVAGGFTTVCCMPNTRPAIDSPEVVRYVLDRAARAACRVFPVAAATKGREGAEPTEFRLLAQAGAVGFSDDGDGIASAGVMLRVMREVAPLGLAFMQHCQDATLTRGAAMHAGEVSIRLGLVGWPRVAEEVMIERDVRLVRESGCRYHVQHISSGGSVEIVRKARAAGLPVSAEASPHHLLLTHEACDGYDTAAKMNPPLRERRDMDAIIEGVADGTITVLATDHAPHTPDEKNAPFDDAPFGIIGLETALPLYAEALVESGAIDWARLIALMTIEPAKLCNLDRAHRHNDGLGELFERGPADITIIDPDVEWTIQESDLAGMCVNTPFLGRTVRGRAVSTIVAGELRHEIVSARVV
ncbi:MAG TPA: dihydroorotase [Phycisphaerales bacterium]|nr:dihydroorotase [Phycisphaerales bacterium]